MKIGLLFPQSELYPAIRRDLMLGLSMAQQFSGITNWEIVPEFIGSGATAQVEQAINKCSYQHDCDVVVAWVNSKVMLALQSTIEKLQLPVIVLNVGEHLSSPAWKLPYLFFHTAGLWQSEVFLASWMQSTFGGDCSINTSLFDSGYDLLEAYRLGLSKSNGRQMHLNMLKNPPGVFQTQSLFESTAVQQPSHIHALLSGKEAVSFMTDYNAPTNDQQTPLSLSPFMIEEKLPLACNLKEAYTANTWMMQSNAIDGALAFWKHQQHSEPNVFQLLAYETGLVLAAIAVAEKQLTAPVIRQALHHTTVEGPRGKLQLNVLPHEQDESICLYKIAVQQGVVYRELVGRFSFNTAADAQLFLSAGQSISGWQNPYLFL